MRDAGWIAEASGARLVRGGPGSPRRVVIDSREVGPGDLFVGLVGTQTDGGRFAASALEAGAWGVLVTPQWAAGLDGVVLTAEDPLAALGRMAREWRIELGCEVIAVTGSVGKTSTKELIAAMLAPELRVVASRANFNTDIGMPLEILAAPEGTEALVLEAAMRGFGQIATLAAICEPNVAVITNIGPVHLEQVGSLEGVARAKAELFAGLEEGGVAVVPAGEPLLEPYLREPYLRGPQSVVRFGDGGDVYFDARHGGRRRRAARARAAVHRAPSAGERAGGGGRGARRSGSRRRGASTSRSARYAVSGSRSRSAPRSSTTATTPARSRCARRSTSSRPTAPAGRRVAVLGDMLELGAESEALHREVGEVALAAGVDLLVTVGPRSVVMLDAFDGESYAVADAAEAAALAGELIEAGDVVLVKGSRGVGLEVVAEALMAAEEAPHG